MTYCGVLPTSLPPSPCSEGAPTRSPTVQSNLQSPIRTATPPQRLLVTSARLSAESAGSSLQPMPAQTCQPPRRQHADITSQRVTRQLRPGFTASGDRIIHAQLYGITGRCVAVDNNGAYKLLTATEAGGLHAIQAALDAKAATIYTGDLKHERPKVPELGGIRHKFVCPHKMEPF